MNVPFLLSEAQMAVIALYFPLSHGVPRVDDRRVVSGIVYVTRNGLPWRDAPKGYGYAQDATIDVRTPSSPPYSSLL